MCVFCSDSVFEKLEGGVVCRKSAEEKDVCLGVRVCVCV